MARLLDPNKKDNRELEEELSLRPLTFDEYVGQSEIKENLRVFIGAAR